MSTLLESFSTLFDAATTSPGYTNRLREVFTPMFNELSTNIRADIKDELHDLKTGLIQQKQETQALANRVTDLERISAEHVKYNNTMSESLQQQQRYLESVDFDRRRHNLIITGITENTPIPSSNGEPANTDEEKIATIMEYIGKPEIEITSIDRLGSSTATAPDRRPRARPIKVSLKKRIQQYFENSW